MPLPSRSFSHRMGYIPEAYGVALYSVPPSLCPGADVCQRPLRSRFRQQLSTSARHLPLEPASVASTGWGAADPAAKHAADPGTLLTRAGVVLHDASTTILLGGPGLSVRRPAHGGSPWATHNRIGRSGVLFLEEVTRPSRPSP
jgi:hypothetical protein